MTTLEILKHAKADCLAEWIKADRQLRKGPEFRPWIEKEAKKHADYLEISKMLEMEESN